ncbi:histidine triad (HIT) family protein [Pseudoduganella flava]|uniref:HIT domain-containing protein n=1 Tax=Pseudoduganella flava TaxID=871742 RepID=A0A562PGP9_9BURK|nr:histidine triad nucleotide-binding protein [Pseudoduganella flava]QGZ40237.1 HIT domain-containing protein [Pseudoduganella flava]TWI43420.1 histidine triad (HIT) family protein [Pseudoduganella flava]
MDNCLFCKIAAKQIPAAVVYEDDELMAFKDINPAAPVHLLVIPKKHISTLSDAQPEDTTILGKMLALAPKLAEEHGVSVVHAEGGPTRGYKTLINSGPDGGQVIYHLHMHIYGGPRPWKGMH